MVTHNETSTGVTNPVEEIAKIVTGESDKLLLVDAVYPDAGGRLGLRSGGHCLPERVQSHQARHSLA